VLPPERTAVGAHVWDKTIMPYVRSMERGAGLQVLPEVYAHMAAWFSDASQIAASSTPWTGEVAELVNAFEKALMHFDHNLISFNAGESSQTNNAQLNFTYDSIIYLADLTHHLAALIDVPPLRVEFITQSQNIFGASHMCYQYDGGKIVYVPVCIGVKIKEVELPVHADGPEFDYLNGALVTATPVCHKPLALACLKNLQAYRVRNIRAMIYKYTDDAGLFTPMDLGLAADRFIRDGIFRRITRQPEMDAVSWQQPGRIHDRGEDLLLTILRDCYSKLDVVSILDYSGMDHA